MLRSYRLGGGTDCGAARRARGPAGAVAIAALLVAGCGGNDSGDIEDSAREFLDAYYGQDCGRLQDSLADDSYQFVDLEGEPGSLFDSSSPIPTSVTFDGGQCSFTHEKTSFEVTASEVGNVNEEGGSRYTKVTMTLERRGDQPQKVEIGLTEVDGTWKVSQVADPTIPASSDVNGDGYIDAGAIPVDLG